MSNHKISAIQRTFKRELKRMISRPIYLLGSVGIMTFCFIFFLTFFNEGQPNKMPVGVVDKDNSSLSRQFIRNVNATQQVKVVMHLNSHKEAREEMQMGHIYAFIEVDHGFAANLLSNRRPTLTFYVNSSYLVAGSLLLKDISYMSALTSGAMERQVLLAKGVEDSRIMGVIQPIVLDTHLIGNPWANYGTYLLNVLLPGVLQLAILLMTIFSVGIEFKDRTSHVWLQNAEDSMFAAITGKLLPYTIVFSVLGIISNLLLYSYMHYPMNSSICWMFLNTFLYVLAYQAVGILLIGITPVLRDGVTIAAFYGLLGFTFAGFTFPIEQLPYAAQIFSVLFPIRHYFNIYVNEALLGLNIGHSVISFVILLSFNILPLLVYHRLKNAAIKQNYPTK